MAQTKISVSFFLPTTSLSRVSDCFEAVRKVLENEHKARDFFTQIEGPYSSDENEGQDNGNSKGKAGSDVGQRRPDADASTGTGSDAPDAPKRRRGRPPLPKSDASTETGPGPSEGTGQQRDQQQRPGNAEGTGRNELQRTREGPSEGRDEGSQRDGGTGRGGSSRGGSDQAPRVNPDDDWGTDDWGSGPDNTGDIEPAEAVNLPGDEWPDHLTPEKVDRTDLNTLLGDHYRATGGKDRTATYEIMERVTGERQVNNVKESDYVRLAKALLKDTARYEFGIKKPK